MEPTVSGARFGTVTTKLWVTSNPPGSVAVTVTIDLPFARAPTVNTLSCPDTARTTVSEAAAV